MTFLEPSCPPKLLRGVSSTEFQIWTTPPPKEINRLLSGRYSTRLPPRMPCLSAPLVRSQVCMSRAPLLDTMFFPVGEKLADSIDLTFRLPNSLISFPDS